LTIHVSGITLGCGYPQGLEVKLNIIIFFGTNTFIKKEIFSFAFHFVLMATATNAKGDKL